MNATDRLRELLDERGVEYYKHEDDEPLRKLVKADKPATSWRIGGASVCAVPIEGSDLFDLWVDHCTPEQAIEATLGRGECVMEYGGDVTEDTARVMGVYFCSECGSPTYNDCMPHFCIYCGKAVKR